MLLPQYILDIFAIYEANGYEAFVVGGCVRDAICKRNCHMNGGLLWRRY